MTPVFRARTLLVRWSTVNAWLGAAGPQGLTTLQAELKCSELWQQRPEDDDDLVTIKAFEGKSTWVSQEGSGTKRFALLIHLVLNPHHLNFCFITIMRNILFSCYRNVSAGRLCEKLSSYQERQVLLQLRPATESHC